MIWATVSPWSCFCWLYGASPSLAAKNIINLILVLTIWWCPCVESSLVLLEDQLLCLLWPVQSLGKTLLAFALLHFVLQGQIYLLLPTFAFQSPIMKRTSFLGISAIYWVVFCKEAFFFFFVKWAEILLGLPKSRGFLTVFQVRKPRLRDQMAFTSSSTPYFTQTDLCQSYWWSPHYRHQWTIFSSHLIWPISSIWYSWLLPPSWCIFFTFSLSSTLFSPCPQLPNTGISRS